MAKKKMIRLLSLLIVISLAVSIVPSAFAADAGLDNFKAVNAYKANQFTDVKAGEWYEANVITAYELGLVKGSSETTFNPDGNVTIAETLALACRLHSIYYTGSADFVQQDPWYQVYVDYAVENGMIQNGQFSNYDAYATRAEFASILAAAMPKEALSEINKVDNDAIPDVPMSMENADKIYSLYRAGILTGNDSVGTFTPDDSIQRNAVAAIVTRMADVSLRKNITLKKIIDPAKLAGTTVQLNMSNYLDYLDTKRVNKFIYDVFNECTASQWFVLELKDEFKPYVDVNSSRLGVKYHFIPYKATVNFDPDKKIFDIISTGERGFWGNMERTMTSEISLILDENNEVTFGSELTPYSAITGEAFSGSDPDKWAYFDFIVTDIAGQIVFK